MKFTFIKSGDPNKTMCFARTVLETNGQDVFMVTWIDEHGVPQGLTYSLKAVEQYLQNDIWIMQTYGSFN